MSRFTFESGATLSNVKVVYGTYGRLNTRRDNAILLPSHYMADHHGYDWLIGPGLAPDTSRYFLVATEMFGNGKSSSPSNTPAPFHGSKFPVATIRDNVEAVHQLLVGELRINRLQAIIGFSMGAEQAFQWGVSYPDFTQRIVATAGTAKCWPHGVVRLESQIAAIQLDPLFQDGNYTIQPKRGVQLFGLIWTPWLFSQEWWRQELWRGEMPPGTTFDSVLAMLQKGWTDFDANDLILQARTWQRHDVGATKGFNGSLEKALASIQAAVLYMPSETDLYFPVRRAFRSSVHPPCHHDTNPFTLGSHGRSCGGFHIIPFPQSAYHRLLAFEVEVTADPGPQRLLLIGEPLPVGFCGCLRIRT